MRGRVLLRLALLGHYLRHRLRLGLCHRLGCPLLRYPGASLRLGHLQPQLLCGRRLPSRPLAHLCLLLTHKPGPFCRPQLLGLAHARLLLSLEPDGGGHRLLGSLSPRRVRVRSPLRLGRRGRPLTRRVAKICQAVVRGLEDARPDAGDACSCDEFVQKVDRVPCRRRVRKEHCARRRLRHRLLGLHRAQHRQCTVKRVPALSCEPLSHLLRHHTLGAGTIDPVPPAHLFQLDQCVIHEHRNQLWGGGGVGAVGRRGRRLP
mmetsp:Transcript_26431/g.85387  ORF Transcript_26431/g.85387 Transcript_26431/m.85387 type:complete len:261 (-) Transcript_26431:212-994(-)